MPTRRADGNAQNIFPAMRQTQNAEVFRDEFCSWRIRGARSALAVAAAHSETIMQGKKFEFTDEMDAKIRRDVYAGRNFRQIAAEFGINETTLGRRAKELGIQKRSRSNGGPKRTLAGRRRFPLAAGSAWSVISDQNWPGASA
jgi:hypothetical protein